jgi:hypothetical protein
MRSPIGPLKNVKIFVLYLLDNINYPLDYTTINDIVMQTDYVLYLDFAEAFISMLELGLIEKVEEDGEELYIITKRGRYCSQEFRGEIVHSLLENALRKALKYLDFKKRGVEVRSWIERAENGKIQISFSFTEKGVCIFYQTLIVDHEERAIRMQNNFSERPEDIYKGMLALMEGNVNYLFDN